MIVLVLLRVLLPDCSILTGRLQPLAEGLLPLWCHPWLQSEEVCDPKTINIKKYLSTNNFTVNNRYFVIKSSQPTQIYITKVFYKQFYCHYYIKKLFFVRNFDKINIFWFSSITRLKQDATSTFDILFCLFKMTFNLKGSAYQ